MTDFRIMPARRFDLAPPGTSTRYGFPIFDHPKQDPDVGFFVASWDKRENAEAAACCLGYLPNVVIPITCIIPEPQS